MTTGYEQPGDPNFEGASAYERHCEEQDRAKYDSLRKYSDTAWSIASRYSHILASETRDLAGAIDEAIADALKQR